MYYFLYILLMYYVSVLYVYAQVMVMFGMGLISKKKKYDQECTN